MPAGYKVLAGLMIEDPDNAGAVCEQTIALAEELKAKSNEFDMKGVTPEALYLGGQASAALGQREMARKQLQEARSAAEAIGSRRISSSICHLHYLAFAARLGASAL